MIPWAAWEASGVLAPLDRRLGELMLRLDPACTPAVAVAAALASRVLADGDTCVDLAQGVADRLMGRDGETTDWVPPARDAWIAELRGSALVSGDGAATPLVLRGTRVSLARYRRHERRLAEGLLRLARAPRPPVDVERLDASLGRLFAGKELTSRDQIDAVRGAMGRGLTVLAGGPGSGKTTTVVRLLAAAMEQAAGAGRPLPRVLLLAPTGKAAARLGESIREQLAGLDLHPAHEGRVRAAIPTEGRTVHRALGAGSDWTTRVRHDADHPWGADLVVVDEASMLDLPLAARVVEALKPGAGLVLIGDPDQLAAVGVGAVMADLVAPGLPAELVDCVARLAGSHRYGRDTPVGRLAHAVREDHPDEALDTLRAGGAASWDPRGGALDRDPALLARIVEGWRPFCEARGPEARVAALEGFRVLCATRVGPAGVEALVPAIERALARAGLLQLDGPWYDGRPILVTANDHGARLYNGDVGVVCRADDGTVRVWFPDVDPDTGRPSLRPVLPGRLPEHETVFAMTVHKSQGSQFRRVLLALPDRDVRTLGRELLYTAVTRARDEVEVVGPEPVLRAAIGRAVARTTGLVDALGEAAS